MKLWKPDIGSIALLLCLISYQPQVVAGKITIACAGNFLPALKEISLLFEKKTGHTIRVVGGSTGSLYAQISRGAPYDIFLAADSKTPALLESKGLVEEGSRFTYVTGQLVLWSLEPIVSLNDGEIFSQNKALILSMANPLLAPYGVAAKMVMKQINLPDNVKIVRGESVSDAFRFVYSGAADMGFVAYSQLSRLDPSELGYYWVVPQHWYKSIEQQAVLLKNTSNSVVAKVFLEYLKSPNVQLLLAEKFNYK